MHRALALACRLAFVVSACEAQTQPLVIRNARVFDGARLLDRATVVAQGGVIRSVGASPRIPPGAAIVDGDGQTLLPGLIDAHSHVAVEGADALRKCLLFGVTTVLDLFHPVPAELAKLRELSESDQAGFAGIRSAGICATVPNGHGTEYGYPIPTVQNPGDAQAFVDARIAEGADFIKIIHASSPGREETSPELVRALVLAAHRRHKITLVCIRSDRDAFEALDAGADGLAHLFLAGDVPPAFGRLVSSHHAFVIPTAAVTIPSCRPRFDEEVLADRYLLPFLSPSDLSSLKNAIPLPPSSVCDNFVQAIAQLRAARVPILAGTDAPNPATSYGAALHGEMLLLTQLGLTPAEALAAATSAPAGVFHLNDRGRIKPGLRADLLLVRGDPLADIRATRNIAGIWRAGLPIDRGALRRAIAPAH